MRPVCLRVRGFTAFRDEAVVDFTGRRLFVITGPTGAGKSSLLDAMTWALYGRVPRVGTQVRQLVSQGEREMSVLFEFTVRDRRYRVARRHPGTTSTRLERFTNEQWAPIADRATDVTREVERLLGMDYATFTRAIVLPQGEFDAFLRGESRERRSILSQLIGLGVYQRAGEIARARAGEHRTKAEAIGAQIEQLGFATPEVIASLREEEQRLGRRGDELAERRRALTALADLARTHHEQQQAASRATDAVREAEGEATEAKAALDAADTLLRERRDEVQRIEREQAELRYDPAEHERLKAQVARLDERAEAEQALSTARHDLEASEAAARTAREAHDAARERLQQAEQAHREAAREGRQAEAALVKAIGRGHLLRERLDAEATDLDRRAATAEAAARDAEQRRRDLEDVRARLAAAEDDRTRAADAARRAQEARDARAEEAQAATRAREEAEREAAGAREALDRARAEDAAAHLRTGLNIGDPCPVCGEPITSLAEHAAPDLDRVTQALERAEAALAQARTEAERAAAALAAAEARVEETARSLAAAEAHASAIHNRLDELDVRPDALDRAIADAGRDAEREATAAAEARTAAQAARDLLQATREALARAPSTVEPAEAKRLPADRASVVTELTTALDAHAAAATATRDAERLAATATTEARAAEREVEVAGREVTRVQEAVRQAEQRLAALGGVEGDPAAVREALARAEGLARQQATLAEALREGREALASAEASRQGAARQLERAEEMLARRRTEAEAAAASQRAAWDTLVAAWRQTIGESEPRLAALKEAQEAHQQEELATTRDLERTRTEIERATAQIEQRERMTREAAEHRAQADLLGGVATDLRGDRFIAFLLHESMQLLANDASVRLAQFTNDRYALVAEEDEFLVVDHLNGDERRSVKTLSGGETFLASLALALALSEHLPEISGTGGAVSLESLFLDEGFGALDAEALDLAVQGLETLADGSRMIGVISHVEELSERLPDHVRVEKGSHGSIVVA